MLKIIYNFFGFKLKIFFIKVFTKKNLIISIFSTFFLIMFRYIIYYYLEIDLLDLQTIFSVSFDTLIKSVAYFIIAYVRLIISELYDLNFGVSYMEASGSDLGSGTSDITSSNNDNEFYHGIARTPLPAGGSTNNNYSRDSHILTSIFRKISVEFTHPRQINLMVEGGNYTYTYNGITYIVEDYNDVFYTFIKSAAKDEQLSSFSSSDITSFTPKTTEYLN